MENWWAGVSVASDSFVEHEEGEKETDVRFLPEQQLWFRKEKSSRSTITFKLPAAFSMSSEATVAFKFLVKLTFFVLFLLHNLIALRI